MKFKFLSIAALLLLLTGFKCGRTSYYKTYALDECFNSAVFPEDRKLTSEDVSGFKMPIDEYDSVNLEKNDCKPMAFDFKEVNPKIESWQCYNISYYKTKKGKRTVRLTIPFLFAYLKDDSGKVSSAAIETAIFGGPPDIEVINEHYKNLEIALSKSKDTTCWHPQHEAKRLNLKDLN